MRLIKLAAAVLNQTPLDWDGNMHRIVSAIDSARAAGAAIVCLPELCISGYGCEDAFHSPATAETAWEVLLEILPETKGLVCSLGLPLFHHNAVFNCACLIVDGAIAGFVAKQFLAGDGIHYEPRWFKPWPAGIQNRFEREHASYPLGDLYFEISGVRIGFEICEDAWVANRPGAALARRSVDIILNPSASHFAFGKIETRKRFVIEGSRAFGVSYVYANLLGNEAGRAIYDGGALIATAGKLAAAGERFSFKDWDVTTAVVNLDLTRTAQARTASYIPDLNESAAHRIRMEFSFPRQAPEISKIEMADWESSRWIKEEEFTRALVLALFDYLRKSRSSAFVISLSGGADSSAVAILCALLVRAGFASLGRNEFLQKLKYIAGLEEKNEKSIVRALVTCVYQGTVNSSQTTRDAARTIAGSIGAEFLEWEVDDLVGSCRGLAERAIRRELDWASDDVPLQNIQARVRAPAIWLLANVRNALLLATSNRSEAAVGYATMDGDTCGGLSPIAGIDKAFLRSWLAWMEKEGPAGFGPIPALSVINAQAPTAELRPLAQTQTDEADLMPYPLLDSIERAAIRDKQSPIEVYALMRTRFPEYTPEQLGCWVERFFTLWTRNQWKRERYAPSFHVDDANLDPKTWCRFPILSGGYRRELAALRKLIAAENKPA